jgi:hypothetical protein
VRKEKMKRDRRKQSYRKIDKTNTTNGIYCQTLKLVPENWTM